MARIQIGGAGGTPSNNVISSLRESKRRDVLIGTSSVPADLFLADTDEKYVVPEASAPEYPDRLVKLLRITKPDLLHAQHDIEVRAVSRMRDSIAALGVRLFLPSTQAVEDCVDKYASTRRWLDAGLRVPKTVLVQSPTDLAVAMKELGPKVWLRATTGGGGRGALPTDDLDFAVKWIEHFNGWGEFTAAEMLSPHSATWLSIWHGGDLVVAQTRRRHSWSYGNRTLSGVTGITHVAETCRDTHIDAVAEAAIRAIDDAPHGIYGVDMTFDHAGNPNPTEINIGRFFTTILFFTRAGLNMPEIYCDLALEGRWPKLDRKLNPLPDGLVWIRGMDVAPILTTSIELRAMAQRRAT